MDLLKWSPLDEKYHHSTMKGLFGLFRGFENHMQGTKVVLGIRQAWCVHHYFHHVNPSPNLPKNALNVSFQINNLEKKKSSTSNDGCNHLDDVFVKLGFQPSTCFNSKDYNINVYIDVNGHTWLLGQKKSSSQPFKINMLVDMWHKTNRFGDTKYNSKCS